MMAVARHWFGRLARRVGRRGSCLLFLALLDILYAYSLRAAPPQAPPIILPYTVWAFLWLGTGLLCLAQSVAWNDRAAFTAAVALKIGWGGALGAAWLIHPELFPRGWVSVVIYWAFAAFVAIVSSWPEYFRGG